MNIRDFLAEVIDRTPKEELKNTFHRKEHNNFHKGTSIKGRTVCLLLIPTHFAGIMVKPIMYSALGTASLASMLFYTAKETFETLRHENTVRSVEERGRAFKAIFIYAGDAIVSPIGQIAQLIKATAGVIYPAAYFKKLKNNKNNEPDNSNSKIGQIKRTSHKIPQPPPAITDNQFKLPNDEKNQPLNLNNPPQPNPIASSSWWSKAAKTRKEIGRSHLNKPDEGNSKIEQIKRDYYRTFHETPKPPAADIDNQFKLPDNEKNQPLGLVFAVPEEFEFWMRGVAITAAYIQDKKGLKNLYVCENVTALEKKVREIANSNEDQRCAFVICCNIKVDGKGLNPFYPQHKVTVCLEKKQNKILIAVLDAEPVAPYNANVNVKHFSDQAMDCNNIEQVLKHLSLAIESNSCNKTLFFSTVLRETHNGCTAFALHDAKAFLRDNNFFDRIRADDPIPDSDVKILPITHLPPEFMVGTQSQTRMNAYAAENPALMQMPLCGKKKSKTLVDCNQANFVKTMHCVPVGDMAQMVQKDANQYMTKKTIQNLNFVKTIALDHTKEEIDRIIANVWVS